MKTKKCSKCEEEKALCEFYNRKASKDGKMPSCKTCVRQRKKLHYQANKDEIQKRNRSYREDNTELIKEQSKRYYQNHKEEKIAYAKSYYEENKEQILNHRKSYYEQNKYKIQERSRDYKRKRRKNDPYYRVMRNTSTLVSRALKKQGTTKGGSTFSALPYSPRDLIEHLERQFNETMTWENYGSYWDVDHIHPQSLLPYDSLDHPNFQKCWALDNLRPLEKRDNQRKSNKILDSL
jgi:hypothetical protein